MPIKHKNAQLNDELSFLIACCQIDPSEDNIEFIHSFLNNQQLDTKALLDSAMQHGILPLVYKSLKKLHIDVQVDFLNDLKSTYTQIAQRNMLMSAELIRIIKLLDDKGIEALAFKGPVLSQIAYGDITLRQYADLDILVDKKNIYNAASTLINQKYINLNPLTMLNNETCLDVAKDFHILNPNGNVHIELHWKLFEKEYKINLSNLNNQNITQKININSKNINTLSNEMLLVYLCIHGSKHMWERIEWICDLDRLIQKQNIDWQQSIQIAKQLKSQQSFFLGIKLVRTLLHTPIPDKISHLLNQKNTTDLFEMTLNQLTNKTFNEVKIFSKLNYQSKLFNTKKDQYTLYFHMIFNISRRDCEKFVLPKNLKILYFFLRPFRLIYKHIVLKS